MATDFTWCIYTTAAVSRERSSGATAMSNRPKVEGRLAPRSQRALCQAASRPPATPLLWSAPSAPVWTPASGGTVRQNSSDVLLHFLDNDLFSDVGVGHSALLGVGAAVRHLLLVARAGLALGLRGLLDGLGYVSVPAVGSTISFNRAEDTTTNTSFVSGTECTSKCLAHPLQREQQQQRPPQTQRTWRYG